MAFQSVWSIDVGKGSLKAVRMQREGNHLEIVAVDKVNYPVGPEGIDSFNESKEAIGLFASRNVINCPVIVTHPGHAAFSRFIQLPPVDARKLQEMIGYEAQQQIPFPVDEVIWDYHVCADESLGQEKEVGIFAVRDEVISDFMLDYESVGIPLTMISIGYLGLLNYILYDLHPSKPAVILDIGAEHTDLLVVDGRRFWIRNLGIAGKDITEALQDKFKLTFSDAERLKVSASKSDQAVKIFNVIQPNLKELVNEIHRSVGFYKSQAGEVKFEEIYLVGSGARLLGLGRFLQDQMKFKVHVPKGFHRIRVSREANVALLQGEFPSFACCVGAGIQALGDGECNVNLMPKEQQAAIEFKKKQKFVIGSAASLIIVVLYLMLFYNRQVESAENALESSAIAAGFKKRQKTIDKLEEANQEQTEAARRLIRYANNRLQPYHALRALTEVYEGLAMDKVEVQETFPDGKDEAKDAVATTMDQVVNPQKFWICNYTIERVLLDQDRMEMALKEYKEERAKENPVIEAYKVKITAMSDQPANQMQKAKEVKRQIVAPLEQKLAELLGPAPEGHSRVTDVPSATAVPPERILVPTANVRGGRGQSEVRDQVQGTFYQFDVVCYLHDEPLPGQETDEEEED